MQERSDDAASHGDAGRFRLGRLRLAVASAALSKIPQVGVQVLAFPVILQRLGAGRFALFFALTSLLAVASLLGTGLFPAISSAVAAAVSKGDRAQERHIVWDCTALFAAVALAFVVVAELVPLGDLRWLVNAASTIADRDFGAAYSAAAATTALTLFAAAVSSFRIGYQETHRLNLLAFWANIFILAAIAAASFRPVPLAGYILIIYLPLSLAYIADFVLLCRRRGLYASSGLAFGAGMKAIMHASGATLVAQLAWYLNAQGTIVIVSHLAGVDATNRYSAVMRPLLLVVGLFTMFIQPAVPSLASAAALGDAAWVRAMYRRMLQGVGGLSLAVAAGLMICGPWAFRLWLRRDIGIDWPLCAAGGLYFVVWMLEFMNYNVLLALRQTKGLASLFAIEMVLAIGGGAFLTSRFGATGMLVGLLAATLAVNTWALPLKIAAALRQATAGSRTS